MNTDAAAEQGVVADTLRGASRAAELLQRHLHTLVDDPDQWQGLIADDILWELAYAPALGHPAKLSGRDEVLQHVKWFLGAVENFRFIDPKVYAFTDPQAPVAQVKAEALIKATGRIYRPDYVVFLRAAGDKNGEGADRKTQPAHRKPGPACRVGGTQANLTEGNSHEDSNVFRGSESF